MTTVFDGSSIDATDDGDGDAGVTFRLILHTGALSAASGNQIQVSFRSGTASGTKSPAVSGAWVGQRSGTTDNFTGNQVQLKFAGANTLNITSAAQTITSDVATLGEAWDNTKDYIVSVRWDNGATTTTTTLSAFANVDNHYKLGSAAGEEALTTASSGYDTTSQNSKLFFLRQIFITVGATDTVFPPSPPPPGYNVVFSSLARPTKVTAY